MGLLRTDRQRFLYTHRGESPLKSLNKQIVSVSRILSSSPEEIYAIQYAVAYYCLDQLSLKVAFLYVPNNDEFQLDYDAPLITEKSITVSSIEQIKTLVSDWKYEHCKCDGGYSGYTVRGTSIRLAYKNVV